MCGLVVEQRTHHQITDEPMKFLTLADWTGMVETELFAQTYKNYGLATVRYPVLEITATVEPFENKRGFSLRVLRAGKPRQNGSARSSGQRALAEVLAPSSPYRPQHPAPQLSGNPESRRFSKYGQFSANELA